MSAKLRARMARDGKISISDSTFAAAAADASARLAQWRALLARHPDCRARGVAAVVAWRAVVQSVAADSYGTAQGVIVSAPDTLADLRATSLPLPPLVGDDSRGDKASRLLFERARAKRPALLRRRIDSLLQAANGSGSHNRRATIERVSVACQRLLSGATFEAASQAAGYEATGRFRSTDGLTRAVFNLVGLPSLARGQQWVTPRIKPFASGASYPASLPAGGPVSAWRGFPLVPSVGNVLSLAGAGAAAAAAVAAGRHHLPAACPPSAVRPYGVADYVRAKRGAVARVWIPAARAVEFIGHKFTSALRARRQAFAQVVIAAERARVAVALATDLTGGQGPIQHHASPRQPGANWSKWVAVPPPSHYAELLAMPKPPELRPGGRIVRRFVCAAAGLIEEQGVLQSVWSASGAPRIVGVRYVPDVSAVNQ
jgi:hypothetical protein